jgi:hypothetical protein
MRTDPSNESFLVSEREARVRPRRRQSPCPTKRELAAYIAARETLRRLQQSSRPGTHCSPSQSS